MRLLMLLACILLTSCSQTIVVNPIIAPTSDAGAQAPKPPDGPAMESSAKEGDPPRAKSALYRSDPQQTGFFPGPTFSLPLKKLWTLKKAHSYSPPVVYEGILFTGGDALIAADAKTGAILWQKPQRTKSVSVVEGRLFAAVELRQNHRVWEELQRFDVRDGSLLWRYRIAGDRSIGVPPIVGGGGLIHLNKPRPNSRGSILQTLEARTGKSLWEVEFPGGSIGAICLDQGQMYVPVKQSSGEGTLYSMDPRSGKVRWQRHLDKGNYARAVYVDRVVYASLGRIYAFEAATGKQLWSRRIHSQGELAVAYGVVYARGENELHALDATDGRELWKAPGLPGYGSPMISGGLVFVGDGIGRFSAFDAKTGALRFRETYPEKYKLTLPAVRFDGIVYMLDHTHRIHAYR